MGIVAKIETFEEQNWWIQTKLLNLVRICFGVLMKKMKKEMKLLKLVFEMKMEHYETIAKP